MVVGPLSGFVLFQNLDKWNSGHLLLVFDLKQGRRVIYNKFNRPVVLIVDKCMPDACVVMLTQVKQLYVCMFFL